MPADLKVFFQSLSDGALDPKKPEDKNYYVKDLHLQHDGTDLIKLLADQMLWDEGGGSYLFTGQRGTGKSTELLRLKTLLEKDQCEVFYLDMAEYLNLTSNVDIQDFLISVIGGFSEKIAEKFGHDPAHRGYFERVSDFLQTEVNLEEIETKVPAGPVELNLKAALRSDPVFKKLLREKTRGHLAKLVAEARNYVKDALGLIRKKSTAPNSRVVLIVDSVERIRGVGQTADEVFSSVHDLFSGQSDNLRFDDLHIVYTIPPYLLAISAALSAYYSGGAVYALSSVHLFENCSRNLSGKGLAQMKEIVDRRFQDWRQVLPEPLLEKLAVGSGGDIRDFFRMVRLCLTKANQQPVSGGGDKVVTDKLVESVKSMLLHDMTPIAENDMLWLKKIAVSHDTCLPDNKELGRLARFFEGKLVLNYRNGKDWYDVHPLIRDLVDQFQAAK